jgi:hypothetical protein
MNETIRIILFTIEEDKKVICEIFEFAPKKNKDGNFNKFTTKLLQEVIDWCLAGDRFHAEIESVNG